MGSLKSPCMTSRNYRSSIETIALNCLVFEKIAFLYTHFGDEQTDERTRWTAAMRKGDVAVASGALIIIAHHCRLKALLYWLLGPKNQSFRNKSGKTQPIRIKFGTGGQVKGWQRSGNFGRDRSILAKMGAGTSPAEPEFYCFVNHATFRQRPIFIKFGHETYFGAPSRNPKDFFENFHFTGHLPPKSKIQIRSNRHLTQSRLHVMGCIADRDTVYSTL